MHRCLDIEEIFSAITDHLGSERNQRELARLARVRRQFTDQALNVLWRENVPLVALLKILPHDLWEVIPEIIHFGWGFDEDEIWGDLSEDQLWGNLDEDEPTTFTVLRPLKSTDWTPRFEYYASKIIDYDQSSEDIYIDVKVYKMFFLYAPVRHLLPNLRTIAFKVAPNDSKFRHCIPFLASLLNPNIENVYFHDIPSRIADLDFGVLLSTITNQCPIVKDLTLFGNCNAGKEPTILRSLRALPYLQYLDFQEGNITSEIFTEASKLPGLQSLYLNLLNDTSDIDREYIPENRVHLTGKGYKPFPQLRNVYFRTPNWGVAASIVGYCARPLQTLYIYKPGDWPSSDNGSSFAALIGTIMQNPHLSLSLRKLHIHGISDIPKDPAFDEEQVVQSLDDLFSLQSLEELSLVCCGLEQLTDAWLAQASTFWPNMRNLYIEGNYGEPSAARFTLGGIVPLVQRWKALEAMGLSLIWDVFSVPDGISNRAVRSLSLGCGSYVRVNPDLQDIVFLSSITNSLLTLFPRLVDIDRDERAPMDWKWEVIQQIITERVFEPSSDRIVMN